MLVSIMMLLWFLYTKYSCILSTYFNSLIQSSIMHGYILSKIRNSRLICIISKLWKSSTCISVHICNIILLIRSHLFYASNLQRYWFMCSWWYQQLYRPKFEIHANIRTLKKLVYYNSMPYSKFYTILMICTTAISMIYQ